MNNFPRKNRVSLDSNQQFFYFKIWISIFFVFVFFLGVYSSWISSEIPSLAELEKTDTNLRTEIYSSNNALVGSIFKEDRKKVTYEQLPKHLVDALIATEDVRYYEHSGIDLLGWMRAIPSTALYYLSGKKLGKRSGASTVTMQVAGNIFTTRVRTIRRKLLEMMTALELERTYSKKEIIQIYFNTMFYGHNSFGIQSAAKTYFSKNVEELDVLESAVLVGLLKGPSIFNPISRPKLSKKRRNIVLRQMLKNDVLTKAAYDTLVVKETLVTRSQRTQLAPYFVNRVHKELKKLGQSEGFDPETDGLKVFTTLDTTFQTAMDSVIRKYIDELQQFSLYQESSQKLRKRYQLDSNFTSIKQADSAFFANHDVQYGFVAIEQSSGAVLAHHGGRPNKFYDHVFQGKRQAGSTTKPFVYATALEQGFTPANKLWDGPYALFLDDSNTYTPKNWHGKYLDEKVTLRFGLSRSMNTIAVRLQDEIGGPRKVIKTMRELGIQTRIPAVASLPLGPYSISVFEMVSAYTAFSNGGVQIPAHTIDKIIDKHGNIIYSANFFPKEVLNKNTAYLITDMLKTAVNMGTSASMRWKSKVPYGIKLAAKTGTTNDNKDAWVIAYTPRFTAGLWVGIDDPKHYVGMYSSKIVPIMGDFIRMVYDKHPEWKYLDFEKPDGVVELTICLSCDEVKLALPTCPDKKKEIFRADSAPTEYCDGKIVKKNKRDKRRRRL